MSASTFNILFLCIKNLFVRKIVLVYYYNLIESSLYVYETRKRKNCLWNFSLHLVPRIMMYPKNLVYNVPKDNINSLDSIRISLTSIIYLVDNRSSLATGDVPLQVSFPLSMIGIASPE